MSDSASLTSAGRRTDANVSKRLARSYLRYLKERVGDGAFAATVSTLSPAAAELARNVGEAPEWIPLDDWLAVLRAFEARFGDPSTLQLLREMTRSCMALAVAKGWSAFLAGATADTLLQRADDFWHMSYDAGDLDVARKGSRAATLTIDGWSGPPPEVVASLCEACVVFLVRMGERGARAVENRAGVDVSW